MAPLPAMATVCPGCQGAVPYVPKDPMDMLPGYLLHARYVMGRSLGRGGFGATYIAFDMSTRQICVIKEFFPNKLCVRRKGTGEVIPNPESRHGFETYRKSFIDESQRLLALARHPCIVKVIEAFQENGTAYYAMEYLRGQTLKAYMLEHPLGLTPYEALCIIRELLRALILIHGAGMLHRDISADNIIRLADGNIKLIDFGSARETYSSSKTVFTKGVYTAPEQKLGHKQRPCTDLYAVGVLMFLLLVGRVPSNKNGHIEQLSAARRGLNPRLYALYEMVTYVNPNFRYQTATDMLVDLDAVLRITSKRMFKKPHPNGAKGGMPLAKVIRAMKKRYIDKSVALAIALGLMVLSFIVLLLLIL